MQRNSWKKFIFLLAALLLGGKSLSADTLLVRSGQHSEFVRLTISSTAEVSKYSISERPRGLSLQLPPGTTEVDTSQVYARIDRTLLEAVETRIDETGAFLNIECRCQFRDFLANPSLLVIDFTPASAANSDDGLAIDSETTVATQPVEGISNWFSGVGNSIAQDIQNANEGVDEPSGQPKRIEQSAERLALDLQNRILVAMKADKARVVEAITDATDLGAEEAAPEIDPNLQARVLTALSHVDAIALGPEEQTRECTDILDFSEFGSSADALATLRKLENSVFGGIETGTVREMTELARLYTMLGFGAEALLLLNSEIGTDEHALVLRSIAEFMEYGSATDPTHLANWAECDETVGMWLLAISGEADSASLDLDAVLRSYMDLPVPLKKVLFPSLSQALRSNGYTDAAITVTGIMARIGGVGNQSQVISATANPSEIGEMENFAAAVEVGALKALQATQDRLEKGQVTPRVERDLLAAFAKEYRGTEFGMRAWQTLLRVDARQMPVGRFLEQAEVEFANADTGQAEEAKNLVFGELVRTPSDARFLAALSNWTYRLGQVAPEDAGIAAARLRKLGLGSLSLVSDGENRQSEVLTEIVTFPMDVLRNPLSPANQLSDREAVRFARETTPPNAEQDRSVAIENAAVLPAKDSVEPSLERSRDLLSASSRARQSLEAQLFSDD